MTNWPHLTNKLNEKRVLRYFRAKFMVCVIFGHTLEEIGVNYSLYVPDLLKSSLSERMGVVQFLINY